MAFFFLSYCLMHSLCPFPGNNAIQTGGDRFKGFKGTLDLYIPQLFQFVPSLKTFQLTFLLKSVCPIFCSMHLFYREGDIKGLR